MPVASSFSDYQPIRYLGRVPIYATTVLTAVFALGIVAYALLAAARFDLRLLSFSAPLFAEGAIWGPLSYAFINGPNFFTALGLLCFYSWGVEIERFLGRARFLKLFVLLLLVQPLVLAVWWWAGGVSLFHLGNYELTAAMLIAFATIYPNIEYLGWIPLKWFAFACLAIGSLMYFPEGNWIGLSVLWATCGSAFGFIRFLQQGGSVEFGESFGKLFQRKPKLRVLPSPTPRPRGRVVEEADEVASIDPLLDKIAKSGIDSLTAKERARLERAREALLKKGPRR